MKIRTGFVSNSSSTSFLIVLDDKTRKFAHYNYKLIEEDVVFENEPEKEPWLIENGFKFKIEGGFGDFRYKKFIKETPILKANEVGLSRQTSICFGKELQEYIEFLIKKSKEEIFIEDTQFQENVSSLVRVIYEYGLDNVLFIRSSDENMGGKLPKELEKLSQKAVWVIESH